MTLSRQLILLLLQTKLRPTRMIQRQDVIVFFRLCRSAVDSSIYGGFQISCSQTDEANNHGPRVSRRRTPRLLRIYLPAGRRNRVVG